MSHRTRSAFTLIEVLVVVSIIGAIAALLMPAVMGAREAARRTECANNQRNLALAMINYEETNKKYPGYRNLQAFDAMGKPQPTGWVFLILPFFEETVVYDQHGPRGPDSDRGTKPNLAVGMVRCPSDATLSAERALSEAVNSYVVNSGQPDAEQTELMPGDWPANGIFQNRFPFDLNGNTVRRSEVTSQFIASGDGLTKTIMLSENADSCCWTDDPESDVGFVWEPTLVNGNPAPLTLKRINEDTGGKTNMMLAGKPFVMPIGMLCPGCGGGGTGGNRPTGPGTPIQYARPSSYHSGGVVAAFADGRVQFLRETMSYSVYAALMTPKGDAAQIAGTTKAVDRAYRDAMPQEGDF